MSKVRLVIGVGISALMGVSFLAAPTALATSHASGHHAAAQMMTVQGLVTTGGQAQPGVMVELHAWPDQAVLSKLTPGQKVPWVLVGKTMSAADGTYTISVAVAKLMPEATSGVVNLEADSTAGTFAFPVALQKNAGDAYLAGLHQVVNLSGDPKHVTCLGSWYYDHQEGKRWATVGESYVPVRYASQKFTYTKGQFSSLGFGMSVSDADGSYSDHGTWGVSSTFKEPFPRYGAQRSVWYQTEFKWAHYHCVYFGVTTTYGQHVNGYAGGARIKKATFVPHTPGRFCVFQMKGTMPTSNNSVAVTWTKKLGVNVTLGFEASAQTGYDDSAQVEYTMDRNRYLCGQKDLPGGTPRQLVVRS